MADNSQKPTKKEEQELSKEQLEKKRSSNKDIDPQRENSDVEENLEKEKNPDDSKEG